MRLWHKDLIKYLPRQQLLGQWRECCAIAGNIVKRGSPNHILVNKIDKFDIIDFLAYTKLVKTEMINRGYKISQKADEKFCCNIEEVYGGLMLITRLPKKDEIFNNEFFQWHNDRYLKQCLFNLQEKYDCGGILEDEWKVIENHFDEYLD